MSNTQYFLDGRKCGKLPEKSNFAQTCNLLSQYMKEKGNLRDLSLGMNGKFEALGKSETSRVTTPPPTMNLLNNMENSRTEKSMDLFPHYAPAGEDTTNEANSSKAATMEAKAGQMTIFYRGQVLVFDDFPAEKLTEITLLANRGISQHTSFADRKVDKTAAGSSTPSSSSNPGSEREAAIGGSDMPIARRASLHRFLEKRKDRSTVRAAPYQLHNPPSAASPKRGDQEEQFDLNL